MHLRTLHELETDQIWLILETAKQLKVMTYAGLAQRMLEGKTLAMIFQKPSLRTRVSFETGMTQLGGHAIYLAPQDIGLGNREPVRDVARVLSSMCDGIMARVFGHEIIEELAAHSRVPVINGLSDFAHPCQILGDLLTIWEKRRTLEGLRLVYIGAGNNVAHSLLFGGAKMGLHVTLCVPKGYEPKQLALQWAREDARKTGAKIVVTNDKAKAVRGADILYTDVWASMGEEQEAALRAKAFAPYQLDLKTLGRAAGALVMHCLPAHYGEEITEEVVADPRSVVFEQAENRLHAQKAVLALLLC